MLHTVDRVARTVTHHCRACGNVHSVLLAHIQITDENLIIGPCPTCAKRGETSYEVCWRGLTSADTGEQQHPDSMVGTQMEGGNVVVEDARFESPPHRRTQARLIRELQFALGLPLAELPTRATPTAANLPPLAPAHTTPNAPPAMPASGKSQTDTAA